MSIPSACSKTRRQLQTDLKKVLSGSASKSPRESDVEEGTAEAGHDQRLQAATAQRDADEIDQLGKLLI